jgi:hypothetical protein
MTRRKALFSGFAVALVLMLAGTPPLPAQQAPAGQVVKLGEGETLTISGFVNATLFLDRGLFGGFGQGQNAEWAAAPAAQPGVRQSIFDGDVRNTRLNFTFNAPPVLGTFAPRATIEADFFGAFPTTGAANQNAPPFADEQPQFRVRFAYVDLTNGHTTLRIGQFWSPMFGEVPVSVTHLAFPLGYGATGMVGWRFPGIYLYQDLTSGAPVNVQLQLAVMKGSGPAIGAKDAGNNIGSGEASGLPQLEGRLNFTRKSGTTSWTGYVVGHVDWKDTTGTGTNTPLLNAWGFETGDNFTFDRFTLHGNFYYGKALGQQFAHITQQGNVRGWGAWAQAGYELDPHWSVWAYAGMDQPDYSRYAQDNGGLALPRQLSHDYDALLRFRAGRYALGLEYFRAVTSWSTGRTDADQIAISALFTL